MPGNVNAINVLIHLSLTTAKGEVGTAIISILQMKNWILLSRIFPSSQNLCLLSF